MTGDEADAQAPDGAGWRIITLVVLALAGAGVLIALLVTLAGADRQRERALALQAHSYEVMNLARTLSGTIARAEASLGRYVISDDPNQGRIYADQWTAAGAQLDQLDRITGDDQQPSVDALRLAYLQRGEELNLTALSTRYGKYDQALARFYKARQAPALATIDRGLDRIIEREHRLLGQRTAAVMGSIASASEVASALVAFGILLMLGGVALGVVTVRTLGARAAAEAAADAAQARAVDLAHAVDAATAELRVQEAHLRQVQKMEAVGQLTGGIAHDFNNMLAVVTGGLELAGRTLATNPAAARRHLDSAAEGAARAAALTRRLLAFSREESLKPEPLDVGELVAGMRDLLDRTLGDGMTIRLADAGAGWRVRADKVQLENAILNLAVNARDAMDGRGELTVRTGTARLAAGEIDDCGAGEYLTLAVSDTGSGMTPEVAERVFEPFFTTKAAGKGTGLGLSQIFALVRQLGGAVGLRTAPGKGTTVTLHLPRDHAEAAPAPDEADAAPVGGRACSVLVVEDDPRVLAATAAALEELGHRCIPCSDPLAAPALLAEAACVDLIVSDVLMPRRTGPEMIAALPPRWATIPVVFVTGFAGDTDTAEFAGRPVLRKPFTLAGLEAAIAEAIGAEDDAARIAAE